MDRADAERFERRSTPWYAVPFVWLLIALPLASVVGGFAMLYLAVASNDGLVVDDYYRHGKEINRALDRDRAAAALGLRALLLLDERRHAARVLLNLSRERLPQQLEVIFQHATRQGFDRRLLLMRAEGGAYETVLEGLAPGHYYIQLATGTWRLVGSIHLPQDARAEIQPAVAD